MLGEGVGREGEGGLGNFQASKDACDVAFFWLSGSDGDHSHSPGGVDGDLEGEDVGEQSTVGWLYTMGQRAGRGAESSRRRGEREGRNLRTRKLLGAPQM